MSSSPALPAGRLALTAPEAAKALGISRRTLDTYAKQGFIPRKKLGGRVLFPVDGLKAFLADPKPVPISA